MKLGLSQYPPTPMIAERKKYIIHSDFAGNEDLLKGSFYWLALTQSDTYFAHDAIQRRLQVEDPNTYIKRRGGKWLVLKPSRSNFARNYDEVHGEVHRKRDTKHSANCLGPLSCPSAGSDVVPRLPTADVTVVSKTLETIYCWNPPHSR
jgi:hypothetical protein